MSSIEADGFLSDEAEEFRLKIIAEHQDFFQFSDEINRFMMKFLIQQKIGDDIDSKAIVITLFCRIIESFQGICVLLERGFMPQAKVLTRATLETYFILAALQKNPALLKSYTDQHKDSRRRALKAACQFKGESLKADFKKHGIEKLYIEQKRQLAGTKLEILTPKEWAIKADMEDFYNLYYVTYSNSTHSNLSAIDDHWDSSEQSINLAFGPSDRGLFDCLRCSIVVAVNAAQFTAQANGLDISAELADFKERLPLIDNKYQTADK